MLADCALFCINLLFYIPLIRLNNCIIFISVYNARLDERDVVFFDKTAITLNYYIVSVLLIDFIL